MSDRIGELEKENATLRKIKGVLMDRVERSIDSSGDDFAIFEHNILLQKHVEKRTAELEETGRRLAELLEDQRRAGAQLAESERRYDQLAEQNRSIAWEIDADGLYTYVSRVVEQVLGYRPDELAGKKHFYELHPEAGREAFKMAAFEVFKRKERFIGMVNDLQAKDGRLLWVSTNGIPLFDADGTLLGYRGIDTDMTDRKRAEDALKAERDLFSDGPVCCIIWEPSENWPIRYISDNVVSVLGYTPDEMKASGFHYASLIHPEDLDRIAREVDHYIRNKMDVYEQSYRLKRRRGEYRWFFDFTKLERDAQGAVTSIRGYVFDQTSLKDAEQTLKDERQRLDNIIRGTHAGTWEWNVQTGETVFNERWANIIGYALAEISPVSIETWNRFAHPDDLKRSGELLEKHFKGELDYYECECRMKHKDGAWVWVLDRGQVASWTKDGKPLLMSGTHQDIADRKRAEEAREKLQAQLNQAQKMESVGRLAGGVAHDFNNMLGVILGHTELAMEGMDPTQPLFADLQEIRKAAQRSADLTSQLLAFARKQTVAPRVLDLNETVEGMLKMLRRLIGEDIELAWLPRAGLWPVKVDPSQLDQILANLCVNARDAIGGVGKVTIETGNIVFDEGSSAGHPGAVPGEYALLAVSDNGRGMDKSTIAHLFEPFFTTKGVGEGTGLGLATVYGIVKQNDGFINVYSEPGKGTTFKIYLPRHAGKSDRSQKESPDEPVGRGHETILLVEDEPAILYVGKTMLEKLGYRVLSASSPGEAIRLAREHAGAIHLLMTDVVMPEMNGRDLARNLLTLYPDLKRLFTSGYTANVIAHHGVLDAGVFFIQKPFSMKALAIKIREALGGGG